MLSLAVASPLEGALKIPLGPQVLAQVGQTRFTLEPAIFGEDRSGWCAEHEVDVLVNGRAVRGVAAVIVTVKE